MREKILIINDDHELNAVTSLVIEEKGYQTHIASDGNKGSALTADRKPDPILLDVITPGLNGYELCRQLKKHAHAKAIPVIFISALNSPKNREGVFHDSERLYALLDSTKKTVSRKTVNLVKTTIDAFCNGVLPQDDRSVMGFKYKP